MLKKNVIKVVELIEGWVPRIKPIIVELLVAVAILLTAFLVCGFDAMVVGNLIGFLRPCHDTVSAIKEPWPADGSSAVGTRKIDMFRKLLYWLIFVGIMVTETLFSVHLVPFYVFVKPAFLVWFYSSDVLTALSEYAWQQIIYAVDRTLRSRDAGDFAGLTSEDGYDEEDDDWRQRHVLLYRFFFGTDTGCWAFDPLAVAAAVWAGLMVCGFDKTVIGNLIGFLYSCRTTVALISVPWPKEGSSAAGIRRAELLDKLTCWLIFAGVLFVEHNVGFLTRSIPYYFYIRTGILIWC